MASPDEQEDPAVRFARETEKRNERVKELLAVSRDLNNRVDKATQEGRHDEALRLEVAATRAGVQAMLVFFGIEK